MIFEPLTKPNFLYAVISASLVTGATVVSVLSTFFSSGSETVTLSPLLFFFKEMLSIFSWALAYELTFKMNMWEQKCKEIYKKFELLPCILLYKASFPLNDLPLPTSTLTFR